MPACNQIGLPEPGSALEKTRACCLVLIFDCTFGLAVSTHLHWLSAIFCITDAGVGLPFVTATAMCAGVDSWILQGQVVFHPRASLHVAHVTVVMKLHAMPPKIDNSKCQNVPLPLIHTSCNVPCFHPLQECPSIQCFLLTTSTRTLLKHYLILLFHVASFLFLVQRRPSMQHLV